MLGGSSTGYFVLRGGDPATLEYYRDNSLEDLRNAIPLRTVKTVEWCEAEAEPSGSCLPDAPVAPSFIILTEKYVNDAEWEDDRAYVLRGPDAAAWVEETLWAHFFTSATVQSSTPALLS